MNLTKLKFQVIAWFVPGLFAEVDRLRFMTEAIHDLHAVQVPYNLDAAFQNAKNMEPLLISGEATIQDRQNSLLEIYKRSQ